MMNLYNYLGVGGFTSDVEKCIFTGSLMFRKVVFQKLTVEVDALH